MVANAGLLSRSKRFNATVDDNNNNIVNKQYNFFYCYCDAS